MLGGFGLLEKKDWFSIWEVQKRRNDDVILIKLILWQSIFGKLNKKKWEKCEDTKKENYIFFLNSTFWQGDKNDLKWVYKIGIVKSRVTNTNNF